MRSRSVLWVVALAVAGCEEKKSDPPPSDTTAPPAMRTGAPSPVGKAPTGGPAAPPKTGRAEGSIGTQPFKPDNITVEGRTLRFAKGKDFFPEMEIKFDLPAGPLEGKELTFQGDKFENPTVIVAARGGQGIPTPEFNFPNDYTMTLKVTRQTTRELSGSIELRANRPANTTLRGTFTAARKPTHEDPLEAADAPYVQGRIILAGDWKEAKLAAGFVGKAADGKLKSNLAGTTAQNGKGTWASSLTYEPQITTFFNLDKAGPGYRHTKLPPGEYLLFARRNDVAAAWKKVVVKAGDEQTVDLTIEPAKTGEVTVTLPDDEANDKNESRLALVPADMDASDMWLRSAFDIAPMKVGQKTLTAGDVPAGKYRAVRGKSAAEVEVPAGKSVAVTLVRAEPKKK